MDLFMKVFFIALVLGALIGFVVSITAPSPPKDYNAWQQSDLELYFIEATPCKLATRILMNDCSTCLVVGCACNDRGSWLYVKPAR